MDFDSTEPEFPVRVFFYATDGEASVSDDIGTVVRDEAHVEQVARETARAIMANQPERTDWSDWGVIPVTEERDGVEIEFDEVPFPPPH
ncbi:hypothetical protein GXW78_12355 [Roseomonas terrae]|uniref:DUF6894 domain-containing protein n=1 Tax=Neoroseomonas terrae TaxID=424799 RepID=A0ABS5EHE7_9PROT|nr:hypothetical protein [Neoroseomonas terrae]MBR0650459.1 hypothetical protein [Neoroseomonas terrae]